MGYKKHVNTCIPDLSTNKFIVKRFDKNNKVVISQLKFVYHQ